MLFGRSRILLLGSAIGALAMSLSHAAVQPTPVSPVRTERRNKTPKRPKTYSANGRRFPITAADHAASIAAQVKRQRKQAHRLYVLERGGALAA